MIDYFSAKFQDLTRQDMSAWEETRPGICEGEAVSKVLYLARKVGSRICIAHVSSKEAIENIMNADKQEVIIETCPHYLALTTDAGLGSLGKVSPPIRHVEDRDKIWEAVEKHSNVIIGSDHNSWVKAQKSELWNGLAGLPSNATILAMLFTEGVEKRGLSPSDVLKLSSYNAAKLFGLYPSKGSLMVGSDADLVIMETRIKKKLEPKEIGSIVDYTPFNNYQFSAWPYAVVNGGKVSIQNTQKLVENPSGGIL